MKAVIVAAGEGIRMRPLTETTPKPLLRVCGKTLLEHVGDMLPSEISEIIIVVGYKGEQIKEYIGDVWLGRPVQYVWQKKKEGTARAIALCKDLLGNEKLFFVVYADDIHGAKGVAACVAQKRPCILLSELEDPRRFGVIETDANGKIVSIEEKPEQPKSNLVSSGVLVLPVDILDYTASPRDNGEEYITDRIARMIQDGHEFYTEQGTQWIPVGYPEELQKAEEVLCPKNL
jgi:UDP-N-acetylglucosamine diphosphorylase / glucose-1-phosphate thymidylyltransferase / UDP-N-acetylgalactosamine diphosphorylase / glucosamine-1-phosphate N-acetyltransferase / galactosamine-1-phosphate N-acetyltransferase